jgi:hypothetical protein
VLLFFLNVLLNYGVNQCTYITIFILRKTKNTQINLNKKQIYNKPLFTIYVFVSMFLFLLKYKF